MANTLRFKRGLASGLPTGVAGEPLFTTDTFDLYIGTGAANQRYQKYIASGTTLQYLRGDGSLATFPTNIVTGTGVAGQVAYWSGASTQTGSNNLFWDNATGRLGLGITTPQYQLHVNGSTAFFNNGVRLGTGYSAIDVATGAGGLYLSGSQGALNHVLINSSGRLIVGGGADNALKFQVTGDGYFSGSVGIGTNVGLASYNLRVAKAMSGSSVVGIGSEGIVDGLAIAYYFNTSASTANTTFTLGNLYHYAALQGTKGAASTITAQYGFFVDSTLIGGVSNYGFYGNIASDTGRWNLYMNGTAANYVNGALGVGTSTMTYKFNVIDSGATYVAGFRGSASSYIVVGDTSLAGESGINLRNSTGQTFITQSGAIFELGTLSGVNVIKLSTGGTEAARITATNRNFHIGAFSSDSGEKLQVNGTMKVTGATRIGGVATLAAGAIFQGQSITQGFAIEFQSAAVARFYNATNTLNASIFYNPNGLLFTGATSHFTENVGVGVSPLQKLHIQGDGARFRISTASSPSTYYFDIESNFSSTDTINFYGTSGANFLKWIFNTNSLCLQPSAGNVGIGNIAPSYKLDVTGEARVSSAIAIGTTPDTNKPFKILKNINATVGINFENTSTSSLAFSAIQMGTDVAGGTKFTNLVYASSGVVANGVYNPDGTSLINNGGGGLNFLGTPTRFYTGGSNGVLRLLFDNEGTTQFTATTPTTNATDGYKQYSADVVAGNAAPHFRTENGAVIKLYQETTGVGNAIFSAGGGTGVLDDSTFDGYTLRQIVKALRNQGILA